MGNYKEEIVVVYSSKVIYATEVMAIEEVAVVGDDVVEIRIAPTTAGMVLIPYIFLGV